MTRSARDETRPRVADSGALRRDGSALRSMLPSLLRVTFALELVVALAGCPEEKLPTLPPVAAPRAPVAQLVLVEGTVRLARGGAPASPATTGSLFEGDVLATGPTGRAVLRGGGRELELGEDTHFRLGKTLGTLDVEVGEVTFLSDDDAGTQLSTPYGRTTLASGTRARFEASDGGLRLVVDVGGVEFLDEDGGVAVAKKGQRLVLGLGAVEVEDQVVPQKQVPAPPPPSAEVRAIAEAGKPQLKAKGEVRSSVATGEGLPALPGTRFTVPAGAALRLETQGLSVRLGPNTQGVLEAAQAQGDGVALTLALPTAPVGLRFTRPATLGLTGGKQPLRLHSDGEASAQLQGGPQARRLEVTLGHLALQSGTQPEVMVKAGEVATVGKDAVTVQPRSRPLATLPLGKNVRVLSTRLPEVGLQLPAGKMGRVQVAISDVLYAGIAHDVLVVPAPRGGQLFWRMEGEEGEGRARFLPDSTAATNDAARSDVVAETGLKATVFFQSAVPALTFNFPAQEGARGYLFRVYRDPSRTLVLEQRTSDNKALVPSGQLPEGRYAWSATALDGNASEKVGGRLNRMEIVFDNTLTTLSITAPREGEVAQAGTMASGIAPLGAKLLVNGKPAELDPGGRFALKVGKVEAVLFTLLARDGTESLWVRRLKR
jgi:hypothetical protein